MDWTASYEHLADRFFRETGLMAPGKSEAMEMYGGEERERRKRELWREFMEARSEEAWTLWHERYGMLRGSE